MRDVVKGKHIQRGEKRERERNIREERREKKKKDEYNK